MTISCVGAVGKDFDLDLPSGIQPPVVGDYVVLPGASIGIPEYRVAQRWWNPNGSMTLLLELPPNPPK